MVDNARGRWTVRVEANGLGVMMGFVPWCPFSTSHGDLVSTCEHKLVLSDCWGFVHPGEGRSSSIASCSRETFEAIE